MAKASEELVAAFQGVAPGGPEAEERKMFGYPASFVHGNMIMGLHEHGFVMRLSPQDLEAAFAEGAAPFAPMAGRVMKSYALLPASITADETKLRTWVARSYAFVAAMPPKEKKPKAPKNKAAR